MFFNNPSTMIMRRFGGVSTALSGARDTMAIGQARVDAKAGESLLSWDGKADQRIEFKDVTGETVPAKLREKINAPRISGPYETGWGFVDYDPQVAERILLTVPDKP